MARLKTRSGFSVTEALVAIAIIAAALLPLYRFQQSLGEAAYRLQTTTDALDAERSALAFLQSIDIVHEPEGEIEIGTWILSWQSEPVAFEPNADGYQGQSIYSVGLYEISATLEQGRNRRTFTLRRVGWRQNRSPLDF